MPDTSANERDIESLASFLAKVVECDSMRCDPDDARPWSAALSALVAERNRLRSDLVASVERADRLNRRVEELEWSFL